MPHELRERLSSGAPLVLDAAMGTELSRRGGGAAPPLWSAGALMEKPELVRAIHEENVAAGAEVLTANTFRTHGRNLRQGLEPFFFEGKKGTGPADLSALAVRLAREAVALTLSKKNVARRAAPSAASGEIPAREGPSYLSKKVFVAGSLSPLEDCYRPDLVPPDPELSAEHRAQAEALAAAGVDLILVETMNAVRELVTATSAALGTGLPVIASMVTDGEGSLLSGEPIADAVRSLSSLRRKPWALGINCVPARKLGADLARLAAAAPGVPLAAYGNTGRALDESKGVFTEPIEPAEYAALAREWIRLGARVVGGCCGTTAAHTAAIRGNIPGSS